MKVRYISAKDGHKKGDVVEVSNEEAKDLINSSLAEMVTKGELREAKEKKELAATQEKKSNAGPGK